MSATVNSTVIPCLRYKDAPAAIEWLCEVIGFEKHLVVPGPDETIAHAQLSLGSGMVMLGSEREDEFAGSNRHAQGVGSYVVVSETQLEAIHARLLAKGAVIVRELREEDYGGKNCSFKDPEGNVWSAGSYDPWQQ
jgi:uncharacterized glyoxalase superfamily protein PhnB